ncbi:MAG TPA: class I SAM-dependent rRNA methyltransferase [Ktedonobacterales bacterium]|nr:class I SAM-dependent rRNA methyltransferase [Ktedonobacterales bacterium]
MSRAVRYPTISLKPRREAPLLAGHAWVFSGAIHQLSRPAEAGEIVDVRTAEGAFIGRGYYHPQTDIAVRLLTRDAEEAIDVAFLRRMLRQAARLREALDRDHTNAFRLVNSEGDGLPGVIIDSYAGHLVAQISTAGMERLREPLVQALVEEMQPRGVLLRNDASGRAREGLRREPPAVAAGEVPQQIEIREHDLRFLVDPWQGQKTGFFLDQRDKRLALQKYARGAGTRVLNCFSYTSAFGVYAAVTSPQTQVTSVDTSAPALEAARANFALNGLDPQRHAFVPADVFDFLEQAVARGERYDVIVLDPPAFAKSQSARSQALRAYRRLNTLGMQTLEPGGILLSCSCSGTIGLDDLLGAIEQSAQRVTRQAQLLEAFGHGFDHPLNLTMPETAYLKAVFVRVL